ncbi:MAG: ABC transporter permease subunit [Thiotrichales bacterium]|nr:ABC transporter permease subunit [Thiotrichales bacterium]
MAAVAPIEPTGSIVRLWRNKEARSVIVQIVTVAVVCVLVAIGLHNVAVNLEAIGKEFSFDFLTAPAAYDITFSPFIEYNSRETHLVAAAVGILNTLLVAVCGIAFATVLGFTMGVLRLSSNWLISRMVYVFIEFTRNVPLLLHILLVHGIVVTTLPAPRSAIGLGETMFLSNRGFYVPAPVLEVGAGVVGAVLLVAIIAAVVFRRWAKRVQDETGKIYPVFWICTGTIVGATAVAFLAMGMPLSWDVPALKGFNFKGGMALKPEFLALWLALSYYTSCFIAEIVRAGILAVSHGQTEASRALGLRPNRTLQLVILPQALRIIVPPLVSQYLNLTKNSSLAIAIGYMDVVATIGGISLMQTGKEVETMIIVLGTYLVFSLTISAFMNWFNRSIKFKER